MCGLAYISRHIHSGNMQILHPILYLQFHMGFFTITGIVRYDGIPVLIHKIIISPDTAKQCVFCDIGVT